MIICAFDCSSQSCSAAVYQDGKILSSLYQNTGLTHSQTLLVKIERALADAGISIREVDSLALPVGPGSFTGIKIGAATAKGLAFAGNIPCIALSSLESAAANLYTGHVAAVMDARRNQFYAAFFHNQNGLPQRLMPDRQVSAQELAALLPPDTVITGDGAKLFCTLHPCFRPAPEHAQYVDAAKVAFLAAAGHGKTVDASDLRPVYIRPPQAERERLEKLQKGALS